jgi:hypothetical protein
MVLLLDALGGYQPLLLLLTAPLLLLAAASASSCHGGGAAAGDVALDAALPLLLAPLLPC